MYQVSACCNLLYHETINHHTYDTIFTQLSTVPGCHDIQLQLYCQRFFRLLSHESLDWIKITLRNLSFFPSSLSWKCNIGGLSSFPRSWGWWMTKKLDHPGRGSCWSNHGGGKKRKEKKEYCLGICSEWWTERLGMMIDILEMNCWCLIVVELYGMGWINRVSMYMLLDAWQRGYLPPPAEDAALLLHHVFFRATPSNLVTNRP